MYVIYLLNESSVYVCICEICDRYMRVCMHLTVVGLRIYILYNIHLYRAFIIYIFFII